MLALVYHLPQNEYTTKELAKLDGGLRTFGSLTKGAGEACSNSTM